MPSKRIHSGISSSIVFYEVHIAHSFHGISRIHETLSPFLASCINCVMLEFPWDSPGIFETGKWNKKNRDEAKKIAVYSNYNYQPIHGKMRRFITEISKQFQAESNEGPQQQQEKISGQQKTLRWKCRLICLHCEMYTLIWLASLICIKKILSHRINQHIMQEKKIVHPCVIALTKCIGAALPPIPSVHHCHSFVRRSDSNYSVAVLYLYLSPSLVRFVVRVC